MRREECGGSQSLQTGRVLGLCLNLDRQRVFQQFVLWFDADVVFNEHKRTVNKVCFHPTEKDQLMSGSQDGLIKLFVRVA